jgi:hypothetical protein
MDGSLAGGKPKLCSSTDQIYTLYLHTTFFFNPLSSLFFFELSKHQVQPFSHLLPRNHQLQLSEGRKQEAADLFNHCHGDKEGETGSL